MYISIVQMQFHIILTLVCFSNGCRGSGGNTTVRMLSCTEAG